MGDDMERWYSVANVFFLYGLPLVVILICYIQICLKSFSRKNCKSVDRPSGILGTNGTNTNEPLGASSVIIPIPENDEDVDDDEDEEEDDDDNNDGNDEKDKRQDQSAHHEIGEGITASVDVEKGRESNEIKQQSENVTNENGQFKISTKDVPNGVKDDKKVSPERNMSSKSKLKYVHEDESDVNQMHLMDGEGQSMLMSSLTVTSTENRSNTSVTKTTSDSLTCSTSKVSNGEGFHIETLKKNVITSVLIMTILIIFL